MLGIDVRSSRELQAIVLALKVADRDVQKQIRAQARRVIVPAWKQGLTERATTRMETRLAGTGRARVSNQTVVLQAAGVRGSKTADMRALGRAVEFGADRQKFSSYTRKGRKGGSYPVRRRVQTGYRPPRRNGYVVFPTATALIPRLASLWVQTAVRGLYEAMEGRRDG